MRISHLVRSVAARCLVIVLAGWVCSADAEATVILVKDGHAQADIVIPEQPARLVKLAAAELQDYLQKITGARLSIVTNPGTHVATHVYVGRSRFTDALAVTDEGLEAGAFRMMAAADRLVLLGRDRDFTSPELAARSRDEIPAMMEKWDAKTGARWGNPVGSRMTRYHSPAMDLWEQDEGGSLNAVYEFLRGLGVRWYMQGELGEIVPTAATIAVPETDRTIRPDFAMRHLYFAFYHTASREDILRYLRLGLNHGHDIVGNGENGHGMRNVHTREEMKKAHPEYYALWGGKRETDKKGSGVPCLSADGLLQENVRYVRALFDIYNEPMVSIMPQDGYATVCGCELCKGKATPERGWYGDMSDYVFEYTDRVAREVYKTHPDKWVSCGAYGTYLLPPLKIERFSPNVVAGIVYHRAGLNNDEEFNRYAELVRNWRAKLSSGRIMRWVHYLHSMPRSAYHGLPVYYNHAVAKDLRFLKGLSLGDFVETSFDRDGGRGSLHAPGYNHLLVYITSRLYWDAQQDVDSLLAEYYQTFYGPAADAMKAFVDYSEANWESMTKAVEPLEKAMKLFKAVEAAAGPADSVHARRVALLGEYLAPMRQLRERLAQGRVGAPEARCLAVDGAEFKDHKLDGHLAEGLWKRQPVYRLGDVATGRKTGAATQFQMAWAGNALYFGIRCEEPDMPNLRIGATDRDDKDMLNGDCVEILLETQCHSYYHLVVSPAGALLDMDWQGERNLLWSSAAEVAVQRTNDSWTVELRVPLTGDVRGSPDPLNGVAGGQPTSTHPFHFNIGRQRLVAGGLELTAFAPTGKTGFHVPEKFAKLYVGKRSEAVRELPAAP